ncbi:MAG: hypothetical protein PHS37_05865 [Candidatus Omnitrophica bacterium]|nr:hypothetical protein [Candidatus Omnitrophota bacterium]
MSNDLLHTVAELRTRIDGIRKTRNELDGERTSLDGSIDDFLVSMSSVNLRFKEMKEKLKDVKIKEAGAGKAQAPIRETVSFPRLSLRTLRSQEKSEDNKPKA